MLNGCLSGLSAPADVGRLACISAPLLLLPVPLCMVLFVSGPESD